MTVDRDDLERRLESLKAQVADKQRQRVQSEVRRERPSGIALAARLGSEFVAGVLVGGALGWAFDRYLGTAPWGMIVFLLLGFGAGMMNMVRAANAANAQAPDGPDNERGGGG